MAQCGGDNLDTFSRMVTRRIRAEEALWERVGRRRHRTYSRAAE